MAVIPTPPPSGGYSTNIYTGRVHPEVQPFTLLYAIFSEILAIFS